MSRRRKLACKPSCSSVYTKLLIPSDPPYVFSSLLSQCVSCYLYLVCLSLTAKLQPLVKIQLKCHHLCEVTFDFLRLWDLMSHHLTTPLILSLHVDVLYWTLSQILANFLFSDFVGHMASVAATHLCHRCEKTDTDNM